MGVAKHYSIPLIEKTLVFSFVLLILWRINEFTMIYDCTKQFFVKHQNNEKKQFATDAKARLLKTIKPIKDMQ